MPRRRAGTRSRPRRSSSPRGTRREPCGTDRRTGSCTWSACSNSRRSPSRGARGGWRPDQLGSRSGRSRCRLPPRRTRRRCNTAPTRGIPRGTAAGRGGTRTGGRRSGRSSTGGGGGSAPRGSPGRGSTCRRSRRPRSSRGRRIRTARRRPRNRQRPPARPTERPGRTGPRWPRSGVPCGEKWPPRSVSWSTRRSGLRPSILPSRKVTSYGVPGSIITKTDPGSK
jgi:hypothetical protein